MQDILICHTIKNQYSKSIIHPLARINSAVTICNNQQCEPRFLQNAQKWHNPEDMLNKPFN